MAFVRGTKDMKPCMDCGVAYPYYVMHYDHREPATKKWDLSHAKTITGARVEIAKCDLVCANCHAERTFRTKHYTYRANDELRDFVEDNPQGRLLN